MALPRLRRAFSTANDDEDIVAIFMDEEEQKKLIAKFKHENNIQNEHYKWIFFSMSIVSMIGYIPAICIFQQVQAKIMCLLSMTSLACTAYTVVFVPNTKPRSKEAKRDLKSDYRPTRRYISYLNGALTFFIFLNSFAFKNKQGVHEDFWLLCTLPAVIFLAKEIGNRIMSDVGIEELESLMYEYKGA